ncbi:uncharacterized protein LOC116286538 [Actinia tenebrosa]|uniref:Uncharacterized protein LOC116286538 n=1 Tax=Actinia tenebrosa TaxID=6105 RepID=A0A6P8H937_ACTTE|nr:uncharacterized protein LOC116286538 [Actinia tenebrosa]
MFYSLYNSGNSLLDKEFWLQDCQLIYPVKMKSLVVSLLFLSCALVVFASDSNDEEASKILIPRPPPPPKPSPNIYLPGIVISSNSSPLGVRYCYCFAFKCHVPGMYNGFKGWIINNQKGYIAISGKLYIIYRCDIKGYKA